MSASSPSPVGGAVGAIHAGDQVADDFLGDEQAVFQLDEGFGGRLEQDDLVRTITVVTDRIGQPSAAPWRDLDDLAACRHDLAGGLVDDSLALVIRHVRAEHEHEFVTAHTRRHSFQWGCPVDGTAGTERKGNGAVV